MSIRVRCKNESPAGVLTGVLTGPYLCSATAGVGTLELECRPQRAKDVMKAMFVAMRFGLG
jgi:hypothetical protein